MDVRYFDNYKNIAPPQKLVLAPSAIVRGNTVIGSLTCQEVGFGCYSRTLITSQQCSGAVETKLMSTSMSS